MSTHRPFSFVRSSEQAQHVDQLLADFFQSDVPKDMPALRVQRDIAIATTRPVWRCRWALAASLALLIGAYTIANYISSSDQPARRGAVRSSVDVANPPHKPLRPTTRTRGPDTLYENGVKPTSPRSLP